MQTTIPESGLALVRPSLKRRGIQWEFIETVILIGAIYALVNLATVRFVVLGPSMQPSFHDDQVLVVSRVHYMFGNPNRGDIVVFNPPGKPADEPPYIKRIIGLPGEIITIREQKVLVNGRELSEPYIKEPCNSSSCRDNEWSLGPDEYFVMGDNRNHSQDSRVLGPVKRERIIGEAILRYWPIPDVGSVVNYRYPEYPFVQ